MVRDRVRLLKWCYLPLNNHNQCYDKYRHLDQQWIKCNGKPILIPNQSRNNLLSSRSGKVLQPQPDFQERELRKKRRLRKKSDLSKFDMSDLKKKLDVISQEEKEDSDNSLTSQGKISYETAHLLTCRPVRLEKLGQDIRWRILRWLSRIQLRLKFGFKHAWQGMR